MIVASKWWNAEDWYGDKESAWEDCENVSWYEPRWFREEVDDWWKESHWLLVSIPLGWGAFSWEELDWWTQECGSAGRRWERVIGIGWKAFG